MKQIASFNEFMQMFFDVKNLREVSARVAPLLRTVAGNLKEFECTHIVMMTSPDMARANKSVVYVGPKTSTPTLQIAEKMRLPSADTDRVLLVATYFVQVCPWYCYTCNKEMTPVTGSDKCPTCGNDLGKCKED